MSDAAGGIPLEREGSVVETSDLQPVVLFFAINGVGLGHLTRALSIARHVGSMTPIFVTTCKRAHVLDAFGIPYHYVPAFEELSRLGVAENFSRWNEMLTRFMDTLCEWYRPAALVTDGMLPFRGLMVTLEGHPEIARIGIRRAYKADGVREKRILARDEEFDQLIVPHRRGEIDVPLPESVPADWVGPLVVVDRSEALPRDEARRELGIPGGSRAVLLQLGAGVLGRGVEQQRALIERLSTMDVQVVVTSYQPDAQRTDGRVSIVHRYPMARYSQAFDMAVAAAGYNTFTELVHHGVPTVFVPNTETLADDQVARARAAADQGAAVVGPYDDDAQLVETVLSLLEDDERRISLAKAASEYLPDTGGRRAAALIETVGTRAMERKLSRVKTRPAHGMRATKITAGQEGPRSGRSLGRVMSDPALTVVDRLLYIGAVVLIRYKAYSRGEQLLRFLRARRPQAARPLKALTDLALKRKRFDDAVRYAREGVERFPLELDNHVRLIRVLARSGDREEAIQAADAFLREQDHPVIARFRKELVSARHRDAARDALAERRPDVALAEVERALKTDARNASSHLVRGRILRAQGHLTEALRSLARGRALAGQPPGDVERKIEGLMRTFDDDWFPVIEGSGTFTPEHDRVLHLLDRSLPHWQSGYTMRTAYTLGALRDQGIEPIPVTKLGFPLTDGLEASADVDVVDGIPYRRLLVPDLPYRSLPEDGYCTTYAREAARIVDEVRPSVIHAHTSHLNGLVGVALQRRFGLPLVYEVRGFREDSWAVDRDAAWATELFVGRARTELRIMRQADRVVTLAEVMKAEIVERGVSPEKVVVIPNAVDVERFTPRRADPELLASLGLRDRVVLGYISTLAAFEGVDLLLRALHELLGEGLQVGGLIVGDGAELDRLRALTDELGIGEYVKLVGRVPHERILDYYAAIDVFVVPRLDLRVTRLVTPLKPFEAMAMERALLVSDVDALREVAAPDERGLSFRAGDYRDLAAQARLLVSDGTLRGRLGRAARAWVERERTWHANGERYRAVYDEVLRARA